MLTLREERKATTTREGLWVVEHNGREVGFIKRYANSKTYTHPWKAFRGIGFSAKFLGSFYAKEGGKRAAIAAILSNNV